MFKNILKLFLVLPIFMVQVPLMIVIFLISKIVKILEYGLNLVSKI